jgi:hypothetical protein
VTRPIYYPCLTAGCPGLVTTPNGHCRRHAIALRAIAAPRDLTPCLAGGCGQVVEGGFGYCRKHRDRGAAPRKPGNPWRTGNWPRIATAYLAAHPACEWPDGCDQPATLVHHRDGSGRAGTRANNDEQNLEALCVKHHGVRHHELHHAGVVELGPTRGSKGSTTPRQRSGVKPRKKPPARTGGHMSQNSRENLRGERRQAVLPDE